MRLEKFVLELLYHHDCVVVPQWGGLVANYRAARLNSVSHVITPPSKHIGFNRNLIADDGLLAHHMGLVLGITHAAASQIIFDEMAAAKNQLHTNGRVVWDKIGTFYNDAQGAMQFMPQDQENFLMSSFGLHPIQLKAIRMAPPIVQEPINIPTQQNGQRWNWKYAAAALMPLAIAGGLWWAAQQAPSQGLNWANINPFAPEQQMATYQPLASTTEWRLEPEHFESVPLQIGTSKPNVTLEEKIHSQPNKHSVRFALIGGAFKVKENANKFLTQLKADGFDAQLVQGTSSIHMVAYGIYDSRQEAARAMENVRAAEGKSAWIKSIGHGK
jgi:cell division septation protein DedD